MTRFVTEALSREHDRIAFRSGVDVLDRYLREFALQDMRRRVAGCFVALDDAQAIVGFYTLAATSVTLDALAWISEGANKSWCSPTGARPVRVRLQRAAR